MSHKDMNQVQSQVSHRYR